ncbi:MAG: tetratricopeptide repeat protein [Candidatus Krumholzibacteria bacterium]|nr:tetratricopeptide repeat protein [Candidatus Krumholzibacteria bacterium]
MKRSWPMLLAAVIALTLLASFFFERALWGLSAWGAVFPFAALGCAIVIVPQMFLKSAPDPLERFSRLRSRAAQWLLIGAVSIALLWLLRSRQELWGERRLLRAALENGVWRSEAPLATCIQLAFYRFANAVFLSGADFVIAFFGIASGVLYTAFSIRAARLLFGEDGAGGARRLATVVLLSGGFASLFFGGGNIPIALLWEIAFLTEALRSLRGKGNLALSAVFLAAAILSHLSAAFLLIAFIYLLARTAREPARRIPVALAGAALVLCLAASAIILVLAERKLGFARTEAPPMRFAFDRAALSNALNAILIVGPASVTAVFLLIRGARRAAPSAPIGVSPGESGFLAICALSALGAFFAGSGTIDGGLEWQTLATTGPALSIYALWALKRELTETEHFRAAASALLLAGLFQTLPLVLVDAMPNAAEKRILDLAIAPGRAEAIIADIALEKGETEKARSWYVASLEKDKSNEIVNLRLGRIAMEQEEYPKAITHFLNAHDLDPSNPHNRFELAEALVENRWFPEAISNLETLTVAYPESVQFWRKLGFARNNGGRYEEAVAAYETAFALEPRNDENLRNLVSALLNRGAELQRGKSFVAARALYDRVIEIFPQDWRAYNNIATMEMDEGHMKKAYEILDGALKNHPYESSLHFNMGIVLERLGRVNEALAHMRTARDLDPMYSKASPHIELLEDKLGVKKPVRPASEPGPSDTVR